MGRQSTGVVCVFAKPPVPGRSKTRLALGIGEDAAARLAGAFLEDTVKALQTTSCDVVLATTDPTADFGSLPPGVRILDQGEGDLGARVERVLGDQLSEYPWAVALGADSPGLPADRLERAISALNTGRAALGPTEDGGFFLLGLVRCPAGLLEGIPWSTAETAHATWAALVEHGLDPVRLRAWFDVDHVADLDRFRQAVPRARAPATWAALDAGAAP